MRFIADLHVHSKYSRATAKNLDLENLYIAAQQKGITVIGTGDFTHPNWFSEIHEKLEEAEEGLFSLKPEIAKSLDETIPSNLRKPVRFILTSEISNIYKKNGKTRKNHNLVIMPNFSVAEEFNRRLEKIGNIHSDGRPILGLDARNLLEIMLEVSQEAYFIPAHIWTPWFSVLGSKSGFNSIEECFEDLTPHIFAVETGLSSDPSMNWKVSQLDKFTLVSNSDAHSPMKLGREANIFNTELSFHTIKEAIKTRDPDRFLGTYEYYPEEGKYHLDGHRKCHVRLLPEETLKREGKCPVCGKPLTLGVLYRVEQLADRNESDKPAIAPPFQRLIPLDDILAEIFKVGSGSKKVKTAHLKLLTKLGSEFDILSTIDKETLEQKGIPLLSDAIIRMRENKVDFSAGYDGEFGKVSIFSSEERERILGQKPLFSVPEHIKVITSKDKIDEVKTRVVVISKDHKSKEKAFVKQKDVSHQVVELNDQQQKALDHESGPMMIVAGPGTGKTRTITHRIVHLIKNKDVPIEKILAVTFTQKAAKEMKERLHQMLNKNDTFQFVATFHSLSLTLIKEYKNKDIAIADEEDRRAILFDAIKLAKSKGFDGNIKTENAKKFIVDAKQKILSPEDDIVHYKKEKKLESLLSIYKYYQEIISYQNLMDYEDLIFYLIKYLKKDSKFLIHCQERFSHIFVDEYQDLNEGQYQLIRLLCPQDKNICVIGDPDQSIYGFRGSDVKYFQSFVEDYPSTAIFHLVQNYRSSETILQSSYQIIENHRILLGSDAGNRTYSNLGGTPYINILELKSEKAEAVAIGKMIEQSIGGIGFHSIDFSNVDTTLSREKSFSDFAILYRTYDQGAFIAKVLESAGIPCQFVKKRHIWDYKGISELLSLLKIVNEKGSFIDFEKVISLFKPTLTKSSLDLFKRWAFLKKLNLLKALTGAMRIPIPKLTISRQQRLYEVIRQLIKLKEHVESLSISDQLEYLCEHTMLTAIFSHDKSAQEVYENLHSDAKQSITGNSDFLSQLLLQKDTDTYDPQVEKVTLMTMHAAKGLEFPVVFIAGCEDGYIPYNRGKENSSILDEERRLLYVAMTRAKEELFFTAAKKRMIYGKKVVRELSPFVLDIRENLRKYGDDVFKKNKKIGQKQLSLFS